MYEKLTNTRSDFLHKLTSNLVKNQDYNCFAIENLCIPEMVKTKWLARDIYDAAWGTFKTFLEYKALRAGKQVLTIGRFEPSSKMCSCGAIKNDLTLKDRLWTCSCGSINDRDVLAAQNIKRFAFCKQNTYNDTVGRESPKPSRKRKTSPEISNRKSKKEKIKRVSKR